MADFLKILGQAALPAAILTNVYTVPAGRSCTISTITVCNGNTTNNTFRISVAIAGAADTSRQYIYFEQLVEANSTFASTIGITLSAGDVVRAYSSNEGLCVNIFGVEVV
jgi:hypothetical protein